MKMRSIYSSLVVIVFLALLLTFSNCEKEESAVPDNQITDIDGNVYTSTIIGTQEWMVENLKVTHYRNGNPIPKKDIDDTTWGTLTSGAYSDDYEGNNINGRLYNWFAVNDVRGLAPEGWHIPTVQELNMLINFLGGESVAGSKLKEKGTAHWCPPNADANNETSFTAIPGDWRLDDGGFATGCGDSPFWLADEEDNENAYNFFLFDGSGEVSLVFNKKNVGWGVRCIKD
jgi:uncharacterized protein (TIGR02145 family)